MTEAQLRGAWAKVRQARSHRDALEKHVQRTAKKSHPTVGLKFIPETKETVLYVSRMRDFSTELEQAALIAGDVFHNLRSALDHLVYQLAVKATDGNPSRPNQLQFPICDHRKTKGRKKGFRESARRQLVDVPPFYKAQIEALQPYPRRKGDPNAALGLLRDFSNHDKHRLLLPGIVMMRRFKMGLNLVTFDMVNSMSRRNHVAQSGTYPLVSFFWPGVPLELGTELYRFTARPERQGVEFKNVGKLTPAISFGEDRTALALCDRIIQAVDDIVAQFEDAF